MNFELGEEESTIPVDIQSEVGTVDLEDVTRRVTPAWLTEALSHRYPSVIVTSAVIRHIKVGVAVKIWVDMTFNEAGVRAGLPKVMVVKAGFGRHDPVLQFTYKAEMTAYRDVLPRLRLNAPACYYAGSGPGGDAPAIIIEDLNQRHVRFTHATTPLSFAEAEALLLALAEFHAQSWQRPWLTDGSFAWAKNREEARAAYGAYLSSVTTPEAWAKYVALPRSWSLPKVFHDRDRMLAALACLAEQGRRECHAVTVGDPHVGNLFFEADGTPGFYDLQFRIAPWSQEFAYCLTVALDIEDRRAWEKALLSRYLARLAECGVSPPPFEEAWNSYCRHILFVLILSITNGTAFQTETVNTAYTARSGWAAFDNDTLRLIAEHLD